MDNMDCIYVTKEQAARIAAITLDSVIGAQLRSTASDLSNVHVDTVPLDMQHTSRHFVVFPDGTYEDVT